MSDSLPPDEGPDPYEGQDLDGLLSGEDDCFPEELQPVARTLDALRAAPMRSELSGEAAARADFRRVLLSGESGPAWPAGEVGGSRTLILSPEAASGRLHPTARPHSHRRPPRRGRWQAKALVGTAAAAVVIVGATALASTLTRSGGHSGQPGHSSGTTSAMAQATAPGSHGVDGTATPESAAKPTPKASKQSAAGTGADSDPSTLCRQYSEFLMPAGPHESRMTQGELGQLSAQAGGPANVSSYCLHILQPWEKVPGNYPGAPGAGFPPLIGPQGPQGAQGVNQPPGHSGNGNIGNGSNGNGNSQGKNGPGFGNLKP
jgi:hypothetical protein